MNFFVHISLKTCCKMKLSKKYFAAFVLATYAGKGFKGKTFKYILGFALFSQKMAEYIVGMDV